MGIVNTEGGEVRYKKSVMEVRIRLDPLEGWGHKPEDHEAFLRNYLNTAVPWYKPEVRLLRVVRESKAKEGK